MTKLQKQLSRKVGDKEYAKWVVVLPPKAVKQAEFRDGDELKVESKKGIVRLSK